MKGFILVIALLLSQLRIFSQAITWNDIKYSPIPVNINTDSTVIVITNRVFNPTTERFFGDEINKSDSLYITVVTCSKGKWIGFLNKDMETALGFINRDLNYLYYVHGVGKSFASNLEACIALKRLYNLNLIAFDYPTYFPETGSIKTFYNSRESVSKSLGHFEKFLKITNQIKESAPMKKHSLLFHSLGAYLYKHFLLKNEDALDNYPTFDNLVLNAPAVKTARQSKWVEKSTLQKRIYITSNENDWVLKGAAFITFSRQLGGNLKRPLAENGIYINFTNLAGKAHNCFQDSRVINSNLQILNFYKVVLNGIEFELTEKNVVKRKDRKGYDLK